MHRFTFFIVGALIYLALDLYFLQAIRLIVSDYSVLARRAIYAGYFGVSMLLLIGILMYEQLDPKQYQNLRLFITTAFFVTLIGKIIGAIFLLMDDIRRLVSFFINLLPAKAEDSIDTSRSAFLSKTAVIAGTVPIAVFSFGILSGAHDYRVRNRRIISKNVPKAFDGFRIVQVSDIHTGSFFNKTAVSGGVDLINQQKGDIVFFTGDLVNNQSEEAKPYLDIFKNIKAPFGVHSTMGNHDYGDYTQWGSLEAKMQDVKNLHQMHGYMGWNLMLNENKIITSGGEQLAILGVENWGGGRFAKYGDLTKTYKGTEEAAYKILLSHDPSHWDAQVRPMYPDIDLTLSGHTHGMQFGIEIGDFRWSPSQYLYKQWADMYQEGEQYLYVNRGFGYLGYPGRVGILPEITVIELKHG